MKPSRLLILGLALFCGACASAPPVVLKTGVYPGFDCRPLPPGGDLSGLSLVQPYWQDESSLFLIGMKARGNNVFNEGFDRARPLDNPVHRFDLSTGRLSPLSDAERAAFFGRLLQERLDYKRGAVIRDVKADVANGALLTLSVAATLLSGSGGGISSVDKKPTVYEYSAFRSLSGRGRVELQGHFTQGSVGLKLPRAGAEELSIELGTGYRVSSRPQAILMTSLSPDGQWAASDRQLIHLPSGSRITMFDGSCGDIVRAYPSPSWKKAAYFSGVSGGSPRLQVAPFDPQGTWFNPPEVE